MELSGSTSARLGDDLARLLAAAEVRPELPHVGSTLRDGDVGGVPDRTFSIEVTGSLTAAPATLRRWAPHAGIRAHRPADAAMEPGTTLVVVAPFGPFEMAAPRGGRASTSRTASASPTAPSPATPKQGRRRSSPSRSRPDRLRLTVRVQARPATLLARLGTPVVALLQKAAAKRYLRRLGRRHRGGGVVIRSDGGHDPTSAARELRRRSRGRRAAAAAGPPAAARA